jgi:hypothetical protein
MIGETNGKEENKKDKVYVEAGGLAFAHARFC